MKRLVILSLWCYTSTGTLAQSLNMSLLGNYQGHRIANPQGTYYSSGWGYYDNNGREYAFLGAYNGTVVIDLSFLPDSLHEVSFIPGPTATYSYREMKTYLNYLYIVSEGGSGIQIVDLSYLPDSAHFVTSFTYGGFSRAHTISESNGYLFPNGGNSTFGGRDAGGSAVLSLQNPVQPLKLSVYDSVYIHDAFMRNDTLFGAAIYGYGIRVVDIRDKMAPKEVKVINYPGSGTHNVWTTDDGKYVLSTDEIGATQHTLKIWDIRNLNLVSMTAEWTPRPGENIHNVFVKGNFAYAAYYTAGLLIADISNPSNPTLAGYYDTFSGPSVGYNGCWGAYPHLPSGKILAFDMQTGVSVFSFSQQKIGKIVGRVLRSDNGQPVSDATIRIKETGQTRWSSPNGKFLWGYAIGSFEANIEKQGYISKSMQLGVRENMTDTVDIFLSPLVTNVDRSKSEPPFDFVLHQNYPNPFNPRTTIVFEVPKETEAKLTLYNLFGQEIRVLAQGRFSPGSHSVQVDASTLPSGVYFYTIRTPEFTATRRMVLVK